MPSIVIYNEEGNILYRNIVGDIQELIKTIHDDGVLPGYSETTPTVHINGMFILAEQIPTSKPPGPKLTAKQCMVLQGLASSYTPGQIAIRMGISEPTIRMHISALKKKFNADSRDQLMAMAGYLGLCDPYENKEPENNN
jgi:DNA-binding CsgD family transcriptional regulator